MRSVLNSRERWTNLAVWTVAAAITVTLLFTGYAERPFWLRLAEHSLANVIFSGICATLCVLVLPKVAPFARQRLPFVAGWLLIVAVLIVLGTVGSLMATAVAVMLRLVPMNRFLAEWYPNSLRISVYFTVIFGIAGTVFQELRIRLASTTLALRTKERDEAEARRLATEAQLASLEARVDPHFLFNTLNSIAALVRQNPAEAERAIERFAALMRSSLDRRSSLVPLDEELTMVRSYLEIERVRFGDRLRFHIDVGPGTLRALVPRMSLQTLAENAVKYAVSPSRTGATVAVTANASEGSLRLTVADTGPGFDTSHLPDGHGLQLLKSRLAMTFGDRAFMEMRSHADGTGIVLTMPFTEAPPPSPEPPGHVPIDVTCR